MATIIKDRPALEGVAAAERALELLTCFRTGDKALTLVEIAGRTGLVKSTIMRLAVSLERYNLIVRLHDGRYQLGSGVVRLGTIYQDSIDLEQHIMPVLAKLAAETQETATFYVRHGDVRLCLFRVNSPNSLRLDVQPGTPATNGRRGIGAVAAPVRGLAGRQAGIAAAAHLYRRRDDDARGLGIGSRHRPGQSPRRRAEPRRPGGPIDREAG